MNAGLNWSDLELLDRLGELASLSAAARAMGFDQTTAARRLARLEKKAGLKLFSRKSGRLVPMALLQDIRGDLAVMRETASAAGRRLKSQRAELEGRIRISSVGYIHAFCLAPAISGFAAKHPRVCLDLMIEDRPVSFERREADIAVRLGGTGAEAALARKVGVVTYAAFRGKRASAARPRIAVYDDRLDHLPEIAALKLAFSGADIAAYANRADILAEIAAGTGATVMLPLQIGRADARLARIEQPPVVERDVFLLIQPDRRRQPSVAAAADWAAAALKRWLLV